MANNQLTTERLEIMLAETLGTTVARGDHTSIEVTASILVSILSEVLESRRAGTESLAVRELFKRAKQLMYQSGGAPIENSLNPIDAFLFDAEQVELQEGRKAAAEPVAYLVCNGSLYQDRPFLNLSDARISVNDRNDGSEIKALCTIETLAEKAE